MRWKDVTPSQFAAQLGRHLLETVGDVMVEGLTARDVKIKSLEAELAARSYKGVWAPEFTYEKHNMVTSGGCLWIAVSDSPGEPGRSPGWKMAVKKGRDGRGD